MLRGAGVEDRDRLCHGPVLQCSHLQRLARARARRASAPRSRRARARTLSARDVSTIRHRVPSTMPAASAPARYCSCFATMLPASRSGTSRISACRRPAKRMCLVRAASAEIALSNPSGPSSTPPTIWPRSASCTAPRRRAIPESSGSRSRLPTGSRPSASRCRGSARARSRSGRCPPWPRGRGRCDGGVGHHQQAGRSARRLRTRARCGAPCATRGRGHDGRHQPSVVETALPSAPRRARVARAPPTSRRLRGCARRRRSGRATGRHPLPLATARIFASGPTSTGTIRPMRAASIGPSSDAPCRTGCTIAQVTGASDLAACKERREAVVGGAGSARASRRWNTGCARSGAGSPISDPSTSQPHRPGSRSGTVERAIRVVALVLGLRDHASRQPCRRDVDDAGVVNARKG